MTIKKPNDYELEKRRRADERKRQNDIKKAEKKIEELDEEIAVLSERISSEEVAADYEKLLELTELLEAKQTELDQTYAEWERLL